MFEKNIRPKPRLVRGRRLPVLERVEPANLGNFITLRPARPRPGGSSQAAPGWLVGAAGLATSCYPYQHPPWNLYEEARFQAEAAG